jgi:hypothetical protein
MQKIVYESLEPVFCEVEYKGKDYRLVELDVPDTSTYKSAAAASVKVDETGITRLAGSGDLDPLLVTLSLKEVRTDGSLGKVGRAFINTLPPSFVLKLAKIAMELNPALQESGEQSIEAIDKSIARLTELRERLVRGENPTKN